MLSTKISREANIHHRDGNRFNNNDGNFMVLCEACHTWFHATTRSHLSRSTYGGVSVSVSFSEKKKAELLAKANYCCARCGKYLLEMKCPLCGETIDWLDQQTKTQDGFIVHKSCIDEWISVLGKEPGRRNIIMTKVIRVDDYTYELVQEVIGKGLALTQTEAINKALASYAGVRYKPPQERKMEQDYTHLQDLAKKAVREE